jgi:hypothetical protein
LLKVSPLQLSSTYSYFFYSLVCLRGNSRFGNSESHDDDAFALPQEGIIFFGEVASW